MFSANELIHYVFAREDVYFTEDLLKLSLREYLWFQLHENYSTVYFMKANGAVFEVSTFGDIHARPYVQPGAISLLFQSPVADFCKWMAQVLTDRYESAAIVCLAEEFCKLVNTAEWAVHLERLFDKARTGILVLVLSPEIELSKPLLLSSPTFALLHDDKLLGIRTRRCEIYRALLYNKGEACVFLNTITTEKIRSILRHILFEYWDRFLPEADVEKLSQFLYAYFTDVQLQYQYVLHERALPPQYWRFSDIYAALLKKDTWTKLLEVYDAEIYDTDVPQKIYIPVIRREESLGKVCLLQIPDGMSGHQRNIAIHTLADIQEHLLLSSSRYENESLVAGIEGFFGLFSVIHHNDYETYLYILDAIRFCAKWLFDDDLTDKLQWISDKYDKLIHISNSCFGIEKDLASLKEKGYESHLFSAQIERMEKAGGQMRDRCIAMKQLIGSAEINIRLQSFLDDVKQMEKLEREISDDPEEADGQAEDEEEIFDINEVNDDVLPPAY